MNEEVVRRTIRYFGRVQGVGFRYTVRSLAQRRQVSGYVRNLPDGTVELVAEGTRTELDRLATDIERAMSGFIRHSTFMETAAQGSFSGFEIRY